MVEALDAHVAIRAMRGPWRPEDVATAAELDPQAVGFQSKHVHLLLVPHRPVPVILVQRNALQLLSLVSLQHLRNHARISHPDGQQEHLDHEVERCRDDQHRKRRGLRSD